MRVCLNGQSVYENAHLVEEQFEYSMLDADAEHELSFELFGKLPEHTKINESGEIVSDVLALIKNFTIDDIDISQVFQNLAVYRHDFNGTKAPVEDAFRGSMGCNGTVTLKFNTPLYLWLLENM
jgi:hypothetical protein